LFFQLNAFLKNHCTPKS